MSKVRDQIFNLKKKNINNYQKSLEKIISYIYSLVSQYDRQKWNSSLSTVIDMFYESFEITYSTTKKEIKNIYTKVTDFNIENIFNLTFSEDGKTIEQRIEEYWNEAREMIESDQYSQQHIKTFLLYKYERIIRTETNKIENFVKSKQKPLEGYMLIIESGCDTCTGGEYPADEDVALPPFHPNCNCTFYYELTDNKDDINDLELDVE